MKGCKLLIKCCPWVWVSHSLCSISSRPASLFHHCSPKWSDDKLAGGANNINISPCVSLWFESFGLEWGWGSHRKKEYAGESLKVITLGVLPALLGADLQPGSRACDKTGLFLIRHGNSYRSISLLVHWNIKGTYEVILVHLKCLKQLCVSQVWRVGTSLWFFYEALQGLHVRALPFPTFHLGAIIYAWVVLGLLGLRVNN